MQPSELLESVWSGIWGLASFRVFVAPSVLLLFYYLGAVVAPVVAAMIVRRLLAHARRTASEKDRNVQSWSAWPRSALGMKVAAVLSLVVFELCWRVMFEVLLAYFQMRDLLVELSTR